MNEADFEQFEKFYNFQSSIKERALRFQQRYGLALADITKKVLRNGVEEEVYFIPKLERSLTGLTLPDGRVLGHKEFKTFFDQNLCPRKLPQRAAQVNLLEISEKGESSKSLMHLEQKSNNKTKRTQLL